MHAYPSTATVVWFYIIILYPLFCCINMDTTTPLNKGQHTSSNISMPSLGQKIFSPLHVGEY